MSHRAVFIICEFDPLHFGHKYLIDEAKKISQGAPVICIMSGNFTQRGECATADKYDRAKAAVLCGADLVLSLPFFYSSACAELFARGAVRIIHEISCGEECGLIFGSESGDIGSLCLCAECLDSPRFKNALEQIKPDAPFANAKEQAYKDTFGDSEILSTPNNILGIEYIRSLKKYAPNVTPFTVKRKGAQHNSGEADGAFVSATYLRDAVGTPDFFRFIPELTHPLYRGKNFPAKIQNAEKAILFTLRTAGDGNFADCGGGLFERIISASQRASSYDELVSLCKTKRYTNARIRRGILSVFLHTTEQEQHSAPTFTQLLASNASGLEFLSQTKKRHRNLQIITKPSKHTDCPEFIRETEADNAFALMMPYVAPFNYSLKKTPFILQ